MSTLRLKGTIYYSNYEYPIAGVLVQAELPREFGSMPGLVLREPVVLGRAVSGPTGDFEIVPEEGDSANNFSCLANCSGVSMRCYDTDGAEFANFYNIKPAELEIRLSIPDLDPNQYDLPLQELASKMQEYRTITLGAIVEELSRLSPSGIFNEWTVVKRLLVLEALENNLLDPGGLFREHGMRLRMQQFQDESQYEMLYQQVLERQDENLNRAFRQSMNLSKLAGGYLVNSEIPIDPMPIRDNDLRKGIHQFIDVALRDKWYEMEREYYDRFPWYSDPLTNYRDYLLEIWKKQAAFKREGNLLTESGAIKQLENRFHQNFSVTGTTLEPVNKLLIPILRKILTSPTGNGFGFNVATASINPQGDLSNSDYIEYLLSLTGERRSEMEKRYRLNLSLTDLDESSPVQLNIYTLQRFFTDSFHSAYDPHPILPPSSGNGQPIINDLTYSKKDHGPFFWQYEEWLEREAPFYGENYIDIRSMFFCALNAEERTSLFAKTRPLDGYLLDENFRKNMRPIKSSPAIDGKNFSILDQWARMLLELQDRVKAAHTAFYAASFKEAEEKYQALLRIVYELRRDVGWWSDSGIDEYSEASTASWQRKFQIIDVESLKTFEETYHLYFHTGSTHVGTGASMGKHWSTYTGQLAKVPYLMDLLLYRLLPLCLAETRLALGKYREAIQGETIMLSSGLYEKGLAALARFNVYSGPTPLEPGFKKPANGGPWWPQVNNTGSLPFSTDTELDTPQRYEGDYFFFPSNKTEQTFYRIRLAEAVLEWADALYRTDQPDSKNRAREMYKGVLFLHGQDPEIEPLWDEWFIGKLPGASYNAKRNPAITVQINRARNGFDQLNAGLNYYGFPNDFVPPLRYRVLKEAAQRFAAAAKSAQNDYLSYMQKYEQSIIDQMTAQNMVEKASYAIQIAAEQIELASFNVGEAEKQVANVNAQIAAKRKEIQDADGFFEQAKSFFGGMKDAAEGLANSFMGEMQSGAAASGSTSMDWKAMYKVVSSKGGTSATAAGLTGGMAIMAGYGAFVYAGYMSMSSMEEAAAKRSGDLKGLETVALPAAKKMVELKKREQNIASLHKAIAEADYQFGKKLLAFYDFRFLSKAFWQQLSVFSNRLMRRYTDLGGRTAWFAERALSFETNKNVRVVSFDYFPKTLRGVTGADTLELHLAELEATRIYSLSQTIPVKHTWSLAKDFPIALGQLKKNGMCRFSTTEQIFHHTHPGVFGYRLRCLSVGVTYADEVMPHKGMLVNNGLSMVSGSDGKLKRLLRYPDGLPLSEFNMRDDMLVYDLPDETLLPFEGSGIDTTWELSLSRTGIAYGLENITDVLITFDMRASYSASLKSVRDTEVPVKWNKSVLMSGKEIDFKKVKKFKESGGVLKLNFDPAKAAGNLLEKNRTISIIGVMVSGVNGTPLNASLKATIDNVAVDFDLQNGIALTNSGFLSGANGGVALPLNAITGLTANQQFEFELDAAANPGVDFSKLADVQLFLEYEAGV